MNRGECKVDQSKADIPCFLERHQNKALLDTLQVVKSGASSGCEITLLIAKSESTSLSASFILTFHGQETSIEHIECLLDPLDGVPARSCAPGHCGQAGLPVPLRRKMKRRFNDPWIMMPVWHALSQIFSCFN